MDEYLIAEPPEDDYHPNIYSGRIDEDLNEQYEDYANYEDEDYQGKFYQNQEDEEELKEDEEEEQEEVEPDQGRLGIIQEDSQEDMSQISSQLDPQGRLMESDIISSEGTSVSGIPDYQSQESSSTISFVPYQKRNVVKDDKKQVLEKQFESMVVQQKKLLDDKLFSNKVQQSLKVPLKGIEVKFQVQMFFNKEQEIEKLIKIEQTKARDLEFAQEMIKKVPKKDYTKKDFEALRQENEYFKKRHHEDQTSIKLLQVEIRKLMNKIDSFQKFDSLSEKSVNTSQIKKIAEVQNTNEDLIKENIELKRLLNDKNDELTKNFYKMKKLNLGLQKEYQKEINALRKTKSIQQPGGAEEKLVTKLKQQDQLITQLRLQLEKFSQKDTETAQKLKEKDKKITEIQVQRHERTLKNMEKEQQKLQKVIEKKNQEIEITKNHYAIDNQLRILFPQHSEMLTRMMNYTMAVEELEKNKQGPAFKQITAVMNPLQNFVNSRVDRVSKYIQLYKTKRKARQESKKRESQIE